MKVLSSAFAAFKSGEGLKGQLLRGGVGSLVIKTVSTILNLGLAIILARLLGVEQFGAYSFALAIVTILAIPAQMGLPQLVVRETAKGQVLKDWARINSLWRWSSHAALAMSAVLMVLGAVTIYVLADLYSAETLHSFLWALPLIPLIALGNLRGAALRGLRYVLLGQLPEFILRPAFFMALALVFGYALNSGTADAVQAIQWHLEASLVAFLIGVVLLAKLTPPEVYGVKNADANHREWLVSAVPLALFTGVQVVNMNVGLVVAGMASSDEEVALLRIALQGATLVSFGLAAANAAIGPYISRLFNSGDLVNLQKVLTVSARAVTLLSLPVIVIFMLFGRELISVVFGDAYVNAYAPLAIISLGQFWNALMASNDSLLNMAGQEKVAVKGVALGAILNIAICVLLVPQFGAIGAAWAYTVSLCVWNAYLWLKARSVLRLDPSVFAIPITRSTSHSGRGWL